MNSPASLPFVIQSLRPLRTKSLPLSSAFVCSANASEPDAASLSGCHLRQVTLLLIFIGPAQKRIRYQRVLHIHDYAGGSVGSRKFFHS